MSRIAHDELLRLAHYNPDTGVFTRIEDGYVLGKPDQKGYLLAWRDRGTTWSRRIFILAAGMDQVAVSRSISDHSALRTSAGRQAVRMSSLVAHCSCRPDWLASIALMMVGISSKVRNGRFLCGAIFSVTACISAVGFTSIIPIATA